MKCFLIAFIFSFFSSHLAIAGDETAVESLINSTRVDRQLAPLAITEQLQCAAKIHANDIGKSKLCSHYGKNRGLVKNRLKTCKFEMKIAEEMLGCGFKSPEDVLNAWLNDPKSKQKIIDNRYSKIGCAEYENYYVCILAK